MLGSEGENRLLVCRLDAGVAGPESGPKAPTVDTSDSSPATGIGEEGR